MTEELKRFLTEWLEWVDAGALGDGTSFDRSLGLCDSLEFWMISRSLPYETKVELRQSFSVMLEGEIYPFGSPTDYVNEGREDTMHLNSSRVRWARETLSRLSSPTT